MKQSIIQCVSSVRGIFTKPGVVILPVVFGLLGCAGALSAAGKANVLYIENNNQATGLNAVLGYTRNADGSLTDLPGSPFYTNGTGFRNTTEALSLIHISEPTRQAEISYAVFCLKKKKKQDREK